MDMGDNPEGPEVDVNGGAPLDQEALQQVPTPGVGPTTIATARRAVQADENRARSPTPPRALYRSTTGKGVAFTEEDVIFLVRFLEYRNKTQSGKVDMVAFWKDVANKVNVLTLSQSLLPNSTPCCYRLHIILVHPG